jgi:hypothetical protein
VELGLPYIEGYKPRFNYQALLAREVEGFLDRHPGLLAKLADAPAVNPDRGPKQEGVTLARITEAPPERVVAARPPAKSRGGGLPSLVPRWVYHVSRARNRATRCRPSVRAARPCRT